nr:aminoglycoside phosphotransferase family protein [Wenjunlia tyrosinilytica]
MGRLAVAGGGGEPEVLADRPDGTVVRAGTVVAKAHAADSDHTELGARLRIASAPPLGGILLAPVPGGPPEAFLLGRRVTLWPYAEPVDRDDPDAAPWEDAAVLLARLHTVRVDSLPGPVPPMRGPAKVARALDRLSGLDDAAAHDVVFRAAAGLPGWARGEGPQPPSRVLVHGDLHLGQLVRYGGGPWLLIDVDDLGLGEPAWDLARPAAWFATGLLAPEVWSRFLGSYRAAGGPAVPGEGDPWGALDVPARALTVQSAALAVVRARREGRALDEVDELLLETCARMAGRARVDVVS